MKKFYSFFIILAVLATGCGTSNPASELKGISIKRSLTIEIGETYTFRVNYDPEEAKDQAPELFWESSKPKIASVSNDGKVKGLAEGSAVITATCGSFTAECKVEVVPPPEPVPVESISLNETSKSMFIGELLHLVVIYNPKESESTADEIEWSSSDESVATVDDGMVKAVAEGEATITAKCGDKTATCDVSVSFYTNEVVLNPSSLTFNVRGGEKNVHVLSTTAWTATSSANWLTVSPASGEGDAEVTITVEPGPDSEESFSAKVTFKNAEKSAELAVTRMGKVFVFSVSASQKVKFSPGNLIYQASTGKWKFTTNQHDYIGSDYRVSSDSWQDLFFWGASGYNGTDPRSESSADKVPDSRIDGTNYDWGLYHKIGDDPAGTWRLLTESEMEYILKSRENCGDLQAYGCVGSQWGFILLPDGWENTTGVYLRPGGMAPAVNNYTGDEWNKLEATGAVFLPVPRVKSTYTNYWTSSFRTSTSGDKKYCVAYQVYVDAYDYLHDIYYTYIYKSDHKSACVRLVKNAD